jgi:hypothetical protein
MKSLTLIILTSISLFTFGKELNIIGNKQLVKSRVSDCTVPTSAYDLSINNARVHLLNAGDRWWDFNSAGYEIPKDEGTNAFFAAALWFGGVDGGGNLKLAAQTYRQSGSDFFSGPLDIDGQIDAEVCSEWDQIYHVKASEIAAYKISNK